MEDPLSSQRASGRMRWDGLYLSASPAPVRTFERRGLDCPGRRTECSIRRFTTTTHSTHCDRCGRRSVPPTRDRISLTPELTTFDGREPDSSRARSVSLTCRSRATTFETFPFPVGLTPDVPTRCYSARSTTIGSTLVARRAGITHAKAPTTISKAPAAR